MSITLAVILIIAYNQANAWWHSRLIKQHRRIYHGWWAAAYVLFSVLMLIFTGDMKVLLFAMLIRKPLFDIGLNLLRGLPVNYVPKDPDSIIDDIFFSLFGKNQELPLFILFVSAWLIIFLL